MAIERCVRSGESAELSSGVGPSRDVICAALLTGRSIEVAQEVDAPAAEPAFAHG